MSIVETTTQRLTNAIPGVTPNIINIIMQLLQSFLGGCSGKSVKARAARRPKLIRAAIKIRAEREMGIDDPNELNQIADGSMSVLDQSTEAEIEEFRTATLPD